MICVETPGSRLFSPGESATYEYHVRGVADVGMASAMVASTAPGEVYGLLRSSITMEPVHIDEENADNCIWLGRAQYRPPDPKPKTGDAIISFDSTGGSQKITQSLQTMGRWPSAAPDYLGAIGVTDDGVEGVDITIPVYQFEETHFLDAVTVTPPWRRVVCDLTGATNNAPFRGWEAGEVLFLGASGVRRSQQDIPDWEVSFRFSAARNRTGIQIGGISGIAKRGWEYLWVKYSRVVQGNHLVSHPTAVYVERVYPSGDFSLLPPAGAVWEIGTS